MTKTDSGNRAVRPNFQPLLLGSGKLAHHLHHYFDLKQIPHAVHALPRDLNADFERLAKEASFIWILVSDRAIAALAEAILKKFPDAKLVHASGSASIPRVHTLHPLNTFGPTLYAQSIYENTPFTVIEEEWRDHPKALQSFFEHFSNPRLQIRSQDRALYHAQCVMLANFTQILWNGVFSEIETKLGTDPDFFKPLLSQAVSNFLDLGGAALTGPLVRQDQVTLQKHLTALENSPLQALYQAFIQFYSYSSSAVSKGNP